MTAPSRQALEQHLGDPAAAAAGVEDGLVAAQAEPVDDALGPVDLRPRDAVVGPGVPVAGAGHRAQIAVVARPTTGCAAS